MTSKKTISQALGWVTLGLLFGLAPTLLITSNAKDQERRATAAPLVDVPAQTARSIDDPVSANQAASQAKMPNRDEGLPVSTANAASELTEIASIEEEVPFVKRLVIASTVKDREPTALIEGQLGKPIVAFVELKNDSHVDKKIVVTFEHESGKKVGFIELAVPKETPRYRTWGRTRNIRDPGSWSAIVRTEDGAELSRRAFNVVG